MRKVLELFALASLLFFVSAGINDGTLSPIFYWTGILIACIAEVILIYKGYIYFKNNYKKMLK
ncbi:MAG: hypothetical protein RR630_10700 [Coprobacillus sp.]